MPLGKPAVIIDQAHFFCALLCMQKQMDVNDALRENRYLSLKASGAYDLWDNNSVGNKTCHCRVVPQHRIARHESMERS